MEISHPFQGVACHSFDKQESVEKTIVNKLLGLDSLNSVTHHDITCYELKLSNKYYETTIHLFDQEKSSITTPPPNPTTTTTTINANQDGSRQLDDDSILKRCQAIILYGDGKTLTIEQLDSKVEQLDLVEGEPRILLYSGIDEDCEPFKTLSDWSIKNGYDFIDATSEDARSLLIDSLSAYKWKHRLNSKPKMGTLNNSNGSSNSEQGSLLNDDTMKKLMDFDSLLGKLRELRGNRNHIEEIAQILSGLLGDDEGDAFLDNDDNDDANKDLDGSEQGLVKSDKDLESEQVVGESNKNDE